MINDKIKNKLTKNYQQVYKIPAIVNSKIYCFNLSAEIDNNNLLQKIYDFKEKNPQSMHEYNPKGTNVKAWHSDYGTHRQTNILEELISLQYNKILKIFENAKIYTKTMWINIYTTGDSAKRHKHSENGWSTLYFPYVESNPTPVIFDNNDTRQIRSFPIIPETGMFLFFPSTLYHHVPTITESKRISIASNVNVLEPKETLDTDKLEYYENN